MKYAFIETHRDEFTVEKMSEVIFPSKNGHEVKHKSWLQFAHNFLERNSQSTSAI